MFASARNYTLKMEAILVPLHFPFKSISNLKSSTHQIVINLNYIKWNLNWASIFFLCIVDIPVSVANTYERKHVRALGIGLHSNHWRVVAMHSYYGCCIVTTEEWFPIYHLAWRWEGPLIGSWSGPPTSWRAAPAAARPLEAPVARGEGWVRIRQGSHSAAKTATYIINIKKILSTSLSCES